MLSLKGKDGERPWEALDPAVARALRPALPSLVDDVIDAVREAVPAYRRPLEGTFGRNVRAGVEQALGGFLELVESRDEARLPGREVYVALGRGELREGRSLEALLAAYRAGAQVSWRRLAAAGDEAGLDPHVLYRLAEAIFAYIDELSAASAEGFASEQSAQAGERQARRRVLAELLARERPAPEAEVAAAAEAAGWPLPRSLAALAFPADHLDRVATRLPSEVLLFPTEGGALALVPDPDAPGRQAQLERALGGVPGARGPSVRWPEAAVSVGRARLGLALVLARASGSANVGGGILHADDHLADVLLLSDRRLAADLAASRLAPLRALPAGQQARLTATLRAWLDAHGDVADAATALHVHPQTVRYRLGQLRRVLGPALDDAIARLELGLALRAADLLATGEATDAPSASPRRHASVR